MPDLTKLVLHSNYPAFKNTNELTGTVSISGSVNLGTNTRTFTVPIGFETNIVDIQFNGPGDSTYDTRPDTAWFRQGVVNVPYTGAGDARFFIYGRVSGTDLIIVAIQLETAGGPYTLTATDLNYKLIDYVNT